MKYQFHVFKRNWPNFSICIDRKIIFWINEYLYCLCVVSNILHVIRMSIYFNNVILHKTSLCYFVCQTIIFKHYRKDADNCIRLHWNFQTSTSCFKFIAKFVLISYHISKQYYCCKKNKSTSLLKLLYLL